MAAIRTIRGLRWQHILFLPLILFPAISHAESLADALSGYPALSQFRSLLQNKPNVARLLTGDFTDSQRFTFLVPSDDAFTAYRTANGGSDIADIPNPELEAILKYHILSRSLLSAQLLTAPPNRLVIPTELIEEKYNNRTAGPALEVQNETGDNSDGQLVIMSLQSAADSQKRQQEELDVLSGLHISVKMTLLDGEWDRVCTDTIENQDLTSLTRALKRASLGPVLDTLRNVTCIGPTNAAFEQAGSPDEKADPSDLTKALTFHTLTEPVYTNFLTDGQMFTTVSNDTIRVTVNDTGIFFNDAKLIRQNVLTNNGVIQIVDRVMSPFEQNPSSPISDPTSSPTSSRAPSASPSGGAASILKTPFGGTILETVAVYILAGGAISLAWAR
ncbi:hypothetical protein GX50_08190 [[Emmonsia] crescens]|uniref:FAS1 domain-containing protein n=1 Tax=[Emmonsia] crescens TaxID=73230 RepID=A0A2B7Z7D6_9EURO|nr:hypothetical protein GX50_08190 [Emmonsia crescens]